MTLRALLLTALVMVAWPLVPCHHPLLHAQAPTTVWWYPDGTPEATRRSLGVSDSQRVDQLVIRWRTTALHATGTILVGAIRPHGINDETQEVVGMIDDTLVILSTDGATAVRRSYRAENLFPSTPTFRLTGLFNPDAALLGGRPRYIGVGVEREQTTSTSDNLWAFLADSNGTPIEKIGLGHIPNSVTAPGDRSAAILPIAAYKPGVTPTVLALVSQTSRTAGALELNSLRRFTLKTPLDNFFDSATLRDDYRVAPRVDPHTPSLFYEAGTVIAGLATSSYSFTDVVTPSNGPETRSDEIYSIALADSGDALRHHATRKMPPDSSRPQGSVRSHVVTLYEEPLAGGTNYRLITENHSPSSPGVPRLRLVRLGAEGDTTLGEFDDVDNPDHGWAMVAADLDGDEENRGGVARPDFPNNTNDEMLLARSLPGDPDIAENLLYLFRLNTVDQNGTGRLAMRLFAGHRFSGRLICAGDMAVDRYEQQEVVTANGSVLSILRLYPYDSMAFGGPQGYFQTLRTFTLDSRVLGGAIADLEGDGENELVVTTQRSTYVIGLPHPQPFHSLGVDTTTLCVGSSTTVRWNRRVGGGEEGVLLSLIGPGGERRIGLRDTSTIAADSFTVSTAGLPPGTYRLRIGDSLVPHVADTSITLTLLSPSIEQPLLSRTRVPLDSALRLAARVFCPGSPRLIRSIDGGAWDTLTAPQLVGDSLIGGDTLLCSPGLACLDRDSITILYRFIDDNAVASSTIPVTLLLPRTSLAVEPGDSSRARTREVRWRPEEFQCTTLELQISPDSGQSWRSLGQVPATQGSLALTVPDEIDAATVRLRLCCAGNQGSGCAVASVEFEIERPGAANYFSPNPYNPLRGNARIVYRLARPGTVVATILDAGRGVVARLSDETTGGVEGRRSLIWDGRTSSGGIVATGAYICLVESDNGESIVIPFYVMQR